MLYMPSFVIKKLRNTDILEVIKAFSWTSVLKVVSLFFSFLNSMVMATIYGANAIGMLAVGSTVINIMIMLVKFGADLSVVRLVSESRTTGGVPAVRALYKRVLSMVIPMSITAGLLIFITRVYIAEYLFRKPFLANTIGLMAFGIPFIALRDVNAASLRGIKKIQLWAALQTIMMPALTLAALLTITFLVIRVDMTPIYAVVTASVIGGVVSTLLWYSNLERPTQEPMRVSIVEPPSKSAILRLSFPMFITSFMHFIMDTSDKFFLSIFASTEEIGVYQIVFRLYSIAGIILFSMNSITLPKFSEMHASGNHEALRNLSKFSAKMTLLLTLPIIFLLIYFPKPFLGLFGEEFTSGSTALIVLSLGQLFNAACGPTGPLLNMTGHQKIMQYIMLGVAILNLALNFLLVKTYGVLGAAVATTVSLVCLNIAASIAIYQIFGYWLFSLPRFNKV
jgi:O-antigen/teichoic acid export membrane protein